MNEYHLIISTPSGTVYDGNVAFISLRGADGDLAVMAGHIPLVTTVQAGNSKVCFTDGTKKKAKCDTGLLTVSKEQVHLLTSRFEWSE